MSAEPFAREEGYEYCTPHRAEDASCLGWERFSEADGWRPAKGKFIHHLRDTWFRRRLPNAGSGWVKFSCREPEPGQKILALWRVPHGDVTTPIYTKCLKDHFNILGWMPLPAPPQEPTREERDREAAYRWPLDNPNETPGWPNNWAEKAFLAGVRHGRETK